MAFPQCHGMRARAHTRTQTEKELEESRKLDDRKLVKLIAGVEGEKVNWET